LRRLNSLLATGLVLLAEIAVQAEPAYLERTRWVMGTTLRIQLPEGQAGAESLFTSCFEVAEAWDDLLSPWQENAPLTLLSRSGGDWVQLPKEVLDYLERAVNDSRRSEGVFDITLTWRGSERLEMDRARSRARLPADSRPLDPGADGKGMALDAMATILDRAGVAEVLVEFGGSSFLARGGGPSGEGWHIALIGPTGEMLGTLNLLNTTLSVSSTIQRRQLEDGSVEERFHLFDLRSGSAVQERRTVAVLAQSATEAEVLSTVAAILGSSAFQKEDGQALIGRFPGCSLGIFENVAELRHTYGGFEGSFRSTRRHAD